MTVAVSKETNIRDIPLDEIKMRFRLRTPKDLKVRELAESIRTIGLLNPITIDNQNYLVCGFHRLSAYKLLGFETIPAITKDYSLLYSELGEIEEISINGKVSMPRRARQRAGSNEATTRFKVSIWQAQEL